MQLGHAPKNVSKVTKKSCLPLKQNVRSTPQARAKKHVHRDGNFMLAYQAERQKQEQGIPQKSSKLSSNSIPKVVLVIEGKATFFL